MNNINIAIADDNYDLASTYVDYFRLDERVQISGVARNGQEALDIVMRSSPDVLVLDMIMPVLDGFDVMAKLREMRSRTKVLAISALPQDAILSDVMDAGATYFMTKPLGGDSLLNRIKQILKPVKTMHSYQLRPTFEMNFGSLRKYDIEEIEARATEIFLEIGIPSHIKGFGYLRMAVAQTISNEKLLDALTKQLYPVIAKAFDTTPTRVERSIRHAIEAAWDRGDIDILNRYFGYTIHHDKGKPTNGQFIAAISDRIRPEL